MEKDIYQKAREKVKEKKKFNKNLSSFLVWSVALFLINIFVARGYMWSLWVIFFWGLAILKQAIDVYGFPFGGNDWEEKEIEKEMERMKSLEEGSERNDFPRRAESPVNKEEENAQERNWDEKDLV